MSMDASSLPNDPALLKELVSQHVSTIDALSSKLAQLEHYIAQLVRAQFGPRSEKLDPNQLALFDALGDATAKPAVP
jgi:transposase